VSAMTAALPRPSTGGKRSKLVPMCPHLNAHGRLCGLAPDHCMCMCLLCGSPMRARRVCGAGLPDGSTCEWGTDNSEEVVVLPELSPERVPIPRRVPWWKSPAPPKSGPAPALPRGLCLPNLEPGQPDPKHSPTIRKRRYVPKARRGLDAVRSRWLAAQSLSLTPSPSPAPAERSGVDRAGSFPSSSHDVEQDGVRDNARHKVSASSSPSGQTRSGAGVQA
jgi:hypothetical protein